MPNRVRFTGFYMSMLRHGYRCLYTLLRVRMPQYIGFGVQMFQQSCYALRCQLSMDDSSCISNWLVMGKTDVGYLLGLGCKTNHRTNIAVHIFGPDSSWKMVDDSTKRTELYLSLRCLVLLISP